MAPYSVWCASCDQAEMSVPILPSGGYLCMYLFCVILLHRNFREEKNNIIIKKITEKTAQIFVKIKTAVF